MSFRLSITRDSDSNISKMNNHLDMTLEYNERQLQVLNTILLYRLHPEHVNIPGHYDHEKQDP